MRFYSTISTGTVSEFLFLPLPAGLCNENKVVIRVIKCNSIVHESTYRYILKVCMGLGGVLEVHQSPRNFVPISVRQMTLASPLVLLSNVLLHNARYECRDLIVVIISGQPDIDLPESNKGMVGGRSYAIGKVAGVVACQGRNTWRIQ